VVIFTYKKGHFTREDEKKGIKAIAAQHTVCLKIIVPVFIEYFYYRDIFTLQFDVDSI
jgi:hypothetical protein